MLVQRSTTNSTEFQFSPIPQYSEYMPYRSVDVPSEPISGDFTVVFSQDCSVPNLNFSKVGNTCTFKGQTHLANTAILRRDWHTLTLWCDNVLVATTTLKHSVLLEYEGEIDIFYACAVEDCFFNSTEYTIPYDPFPSWTLLDTNSDQDLLLKNYGSVETPIENFSAKQGFLAPDLNLSSVECPDISIPYDLDFGLKNFTLECFAYFEMWATTIPNIVVCQDEDTKGVAWAFGVVDGKIAFYFWDGSANMITGGTTLNLQEWYHLAVTRDTLLHLYVNGVEVFNAECAIPSAVNKYPFAGEDLVEPMDGKVFNLQFHKSVYTSFNLNSLVLTDSAVLHSLFNERLLDYSAKHKHITSVESHTTFLIPWEKEVRGSAYLRNSWFTLDYDILENCTFQFFVYPYEWVGVLLTGSNYTLDISTGYVRIILNGQTNTCAYSLQLKHWYHIAVIPLADMLCIFVNGQKFTFLTKVALIGVHILGKNCKVQIADVNISSFPAYSSNFYPLFTTHSGEVHLKFLNDGKHSINTVVDSVASAFTSEVYLSQHGGYLHYPFTVYNTVKLTDFTITVQYYKDVETYGSIVTIGNLELSTDGIQWGEAFAYTLPFGVHTLTLNRVANLCTLTLGDAILHTFEQDEYLDASPNFGSCDLFIQSFTCEGMRLNFMEAQCCERYGVPVLVDVNTAVGTRENCIPAFNGETSKIISTLKFQADFTLEFTGYALRWGGYICKSSWLQIYCGNGSFPHSIVCTLLGVKLVAPIELNTFFNIALVKIGAQIALYLNHTLHATVTTTQHIPSTVVDVHFGYQFKGYLQDIRCTPHPRYFDTNIQPNFLPYVAQDLLYDGYGDQIVYLQGNTKRVEATTDSALKPYENSILLQRDTKFSIPALPHQQIFSADSTVEFEIFLSGYGGSIGQGDIQLLFSKYFVLAADTLITIATPVSLNSWTPVALVYKNQLLQVYLHYLKVAEVPLSWRYSSAPFLLQNFYGSFAKLKITTGVARVLAPYSKNLAVLSYANS